MVIHFSLFTSVEKNELKLVSFSRHPTDSTVFASAGADDQIALWDLALEKDEEAADAVPDPELAVCADKFQDICCVFHDFIHLLIWYCCFFTGFGTPTIIHSSRAERNQGNPLASPNSWPGHKYSSHWLQHFQNYQRLTLKKQTNHNKNSHLLVFS